MLWGERRENGIIVAATEPTGCPFAAIGLDRGLAPPSCRSCSAHNESEFARPSCGRAGSVERTRVGSRSRRRGEELAYGVFYLGKGLATRGIAVLGRAMSGTKGGRACCGQWFGREC